MKKIKEERMDYLIKGDLIGKPRTAPKRKEDEDEPNEEHLGDKKDRFNEEFYFKILNKNRTILLYDEINNCSADVVCSKLKAMDILNHKPIYLEINSPGGSVPDGMSIINAMQCIKSPVITTIVGQAASMSSLIAIVGDKRLAYHNAYTMFHSTQDCVGDYVNYIKDRATFLCEFEERTELLMKQYTKLTKTDILRIRNGELWLNAKQMLEKEIIDEIIFPKKKLHRIIKY